MFFTQPPIFWNKGIKSSPIQNRKLDKRDGFGIWNTEALNISITNGSKILLMEVPMYI